MKQFMGILPLQVGLCTLSATFIMLAVCMITVNLWNLSNANIKSVMLFILLNALIISTWVIAYIGSYESSLFLMTTALKLWKVFIMLWIVLSIWLLFFTNVDQLNEGFSCIDSRCVPSCFLVIYDEEWANKQNESIITTDTENNSELPDLSETTGLTELTDLTELTESTESMKSTESTESAESTTLLSNGSTVGRRRKNYLKNAKAPSKNKNVHKYNDVNFTFGLLKDKNNKVLKRKRTNIKKSVNKKTIQKLDYTPTTFIMMDISGSTWEIILVPVIFYVLFVIAKSTLSAYTLDLKINNMELLNEC